MTLHRSLAKVAVLALVLVPGSVRAQDGEVTGLSAFVVGGQIGGTSGKLTSETDVTSSAAFGVGASYWFNQYIGLRGRIVRGSQDVSSNNPVFQFHIQEQGTTWFMDMQAMVGKDFMSGDTNLHPYVAIGFARKKYEVNDPFTDSGFDYSGGLQVTFDRLGVFGEINRLRTSFKQIGSKQYAREWMLVGGVSLHIL